jgi:hypothetical protein
MKIRPPFPLWQFLYLSFDMPINLIRPFFNIFPPLLLSTLLSPFLFVYIERQAWLLYIANLAFGSFILGCS